MLSAKGKLSSKVTEPQTWEFVQTPKRGGFIDSLSFPMLFAKGSFFYIFLAYL